MQIQREGRLDFHAMARTEDFGDRDTRAKFANPLLAAAAPGAPAAIELVCLHVTVERVAGEPSRQALVFDNDICRIGSHA